MGHPAIDEFSRIYSMAQFQPQTFRRLQRVFRDDVQALLNEREALLVENAALKAQIAQVEAAAVDQPDPIRRGPGRPRKVVAA